MLIVYLHVIYAPHAVMKVVVAAHQNYQNMMLNAGVTMSDFALIRDLWMTSIVRPDVP